MQHLLAAARWDAGAVRDDVREYVVEHLGSPDAVLVVDETGDLKRGPPLIDREVYLPRSWTADAARCAAAGIPAGTVFATKPKLARRMIARALDAGTEPARDTRHRLRWSAWRRRHQRRAKTCHYQRQARQP